VKSSKYENIEVKETGSGYILKKDGKIIVTREKVPEVLQALYNDPAIGLKSAEQFRTLVQSTLIGVQGDDITKFLSGQSTAQIHKPAPEKINKPTITEQPGEQWHADLIDMQSYAGLNNGVKYLLTVIDAFSKFAYVETLKSKTEKEVADAFEDIFKSGTPRKLVTDNGGEFNNGTFAALMKRHQITHINTSPYNPKANGMIERFNKTLKSKIQKFMDHYDSKHYIDALPDLVSNYNTTKHRTTRKTPKEVHELGNADPREEIDEDKAPAVEVVAQNIKRNAEKVLEAGGEELPHLRQGQYVRIMVVDQSTEEKKKAQFRKSYKHKWSKELYRIAYVNVGEKEGTPDVYRLMDSEGEIINKDFFRSQLQEVDIKKLKGFDGERPDFSDGKVFNREKFLREDLPNRPVVQNKPDFEAKYDNASDGEETPAPPAPRKSGRPRKANPKYDAYVK
jgi:hypothetical protein